MPKTSGRISSNFFGFISVVPVVIEKYPVGTSDAEKARLLKQVEQTSKGITIDSFHKMEF